VATVGQAAAHLGIKERAVRQRIADGKLVATRTPRGWDIDLDAAPPAMPATALPATTAPSLEVLLEQLHEKDRQIAERDRNIKDLMDVLTSQNERLLQLMPPPPAAAALPETAATATAALPLNWLRRLTGRGR
jgi:hypothetical protein